MTFVEGVHPADPALGGSNYGHYHLSYENQDHFSRVINGDRSIDPTNEPRILASHEGDQVIQLTYDPDHDGVLDPFNLKSIEVLSGTLNVGIKGDFGIAVYNNLSEGNWNLIDANNITRATLEGFGSNFSVDNIVFEPSDSHLPLIDISSLGYSDFV